jgi:pyruvate/2-oxoglutarate dehydrogenase complex dihydrolipoamide acyltransferase (E2) component
VNIPLPDLGSSPVTFGLWHVGVGDRVLEGERVAEVWIPGAVIDLPAPATGVIREQFARPLDTLQPGQSLGTLEPDPPHVD